MSSRHFTGLLPSCLGKMVARHFYVAHLNHPIAATPLVRHCSPFSHTLSFRCPTSPIPRPSVSDSCSKAVKYSWESLCGPDYGLTGPAPQPGYLWHHLEWDAQPGPPPTVRPRPLSSEPSLPACAFPVPS